MSKPKYYLDPMCDKSGTFCTGISDSCQMQSGKPRYFRDIFKKIEKRLQKYRKRGFKINVTNEDITSKIYTHTHTI